MMEDQIAYLSGLLVGIILAIVALCFVMWRFQRIYDMMVVLRSDMRNFIAEARTELLTDKPVKFTVEEEIYRKNMKSAIDELNKVVEDD